MERQTDGVSDNPGREGGGESGGGAYRDKDQVKPKDQSGAFGHGGQHEIDYSGPDNPNATTGGDDA